MAEVLAGSGRLEDVQFYLHPPTLNISESDRTAWHRLQTLINSGAQFEYAHLDVADSASHWLRFGTLQTTEAGSLRSRQRRDRRNRCAAAVHVSGRSEVFAELRIKDPRLLSPPAIRIS